MTTSTVVLEYQTVIFGMKIDGVISNDIINSAIIVTFLVGFQQYIWVASHFGKISHVFAQLNNCKELLV